MIDIHSHILPGVDDGSFSMEESVKMALMAVESGVSKIIVTPHCNLPDSEEPLWAEEVRTRCAALQKKLKEENIDLAVFPGMEIFGTFETPERLANGLLMPLADGEHPLIEFPFTDYDEEATEILHEVLELGLRPIVAHPERYEYVRQMPEILNIWVDMGCYLQVNRGSLLGRFGPGPEETAFLILERGFASFVASDAHRSTFRTPWMEDVYHLIAMEFGKPLAERLLNENPGRILKHEEIETEEPDWF